MIDKEKVRELADYLMCDYMHNEDLAEKIEKWLEQNQPEPVVVGLSDEQILEFSKKVFSQEYQQQALVVSYHEWQKTQTFAQPEVKEVVVGLSDEQCWSLSNALHTQCVGNWKGDIHSVITHWVQTQTFVEPNESLIADNLKLAKELEQLKSQQLKPSWNDAPEWANWLAQDNDGQWNWHESKPKAGGQSWCAGNLSEAAFLNSKNWQQTLEQRPAVTTLNTKQSAITEKKVVEMVNIKDLIKDNRFNHNVYKCQIPDDYVYGQLVAKFYDSEDGCVREAVIPFSQFKRPKQPTPKVEVGQVWVSDSTYEFPNEKVFIIGVDDELVAFRLPKLCKIRCLELSDFLDKFEQVQS